MAGASRPREPTRLVEGDRLRDLVADVKTGLRLVIGSWKIMAISLPRMRAHLRFRFGQQVVAIEQDRAAGDAAGAGDEAHDRQAGDRFAGARFADDGQRLAAADVEAHTVDGAHLALLAVEAGSEVPDLEQRYGACHAFTPPLPATLHTGGLPTAIVCRSRCRSDSIDTPRSLSRKRRRAVGKTRLKGEGGPHGRELDGADVG